MILEQPFGDLAEKCLHYWWDYISEDHANTLVISPSKTNWPVFSRMLEGSIVQILSEIKGKEKEETYWYYLIMLIYELARRRKNIKKITVFSCILSKEKLQHVLFSKCAFRKGYLFGRLYRSVMG